MKQRVYHYIVKFKKKLLLGRRNSRGRTRSSGSQAEASTAPFVALPHRLWGQLLHGRRAQGRCQRQGRTAHPASVPHSRSRPPLTLGRPKPRSPHRVLPSELPACPAGPRSRPGSDPRPRPRPGRRGHRRHLGAGRRH